MNDVYSRRWELLLTTCFDMGKGTLWKVREDVWKTNLRQNHYNSTRTWHPGLSLMKRKLGSIREYVPMLHGTTDTRGPVVVKGITTDKGEDHSTSFGRMIRPAPLPVTAMIPTGPVNADLPKSNPLRTRGISQNTHKPNLTDTEMNNLNNWLDSKGLL